MPTLTVRDIDDDDLAALQRRASANSRSMSAEVRAMIKRHNRRPDGQDLVADLQRFQDQVRRKHGMLSDSADLIRRMRDEE